MPQVPALKRRSISSNILVKKK